VPDIPDCAEPLIVPLWPDCDVPLVLPVPVDDVPAVLPDVPAAVPVVEPLPLVVPDVELPDEPVPEADVPGVLLEPEPPLIEAFVSIQLLPEPARHPVTVTVFELALLLDVV